GDIGPMAGKPVMEGKGVLFKRFADVDVFDIELDTKDPDEIIQAVKLMEPTFGGINLEDIKAPECFYIEEKLQELMDIPVFHDDQHGTAIISGAGLVNALELIDKKIDDVKVVFNGAGAAGIACAKFYITLGVKPENLILCDSKGAIYKGRTAGMNPYKEEFAIETDARTLDDAMKGADVFAGVSVADTVTPEMLLSMADQPIIFAMANPDPEITYEKAMEARDDIIMATGRSDYPNQVNNVLGFPFIFRGALDVQARAINDEMKIAAAKALADLAKEPVPYQVMKAYGKDRMQFGPEYIIPKPFDPRVLIWEAAAVAQAAMDTGVARKTIDIDEYREQLEARLGFSRQVMRVMINKARKAPKRIVYPEGTHPPILKACEAVLSEGMAQPVLLGSKDEIQGIMDDMGLTLKGAEIVDPNEADCREAYAEELYKLRQRQGVTPEAARELVVDPNYFGSMMVHMGDADGVVSGLTTSFADTVQPLMRTIGPAEGLDTVAAMNMLVTKDSFYFFADVAMNVTPSAKELADIAIMCANEVRRFDVEPRVAMVSFSNFGDVPSDEATRIQEAVGLVKEREPSLVIDGEVQADMAVSADLLEQKFPASGLQGGANVLVFPCLSSSNAAFRLLQQVGGAEVVGPILLGMGKPAHILQHGGSNELDVVNMTAVAVVDAQG
ncbi:MAG: NADP-dependent malic enzyme, partial [bacterium]|nr:NADP-dependent malic enzyme [bacterium]